MSKRAQKRLKAARKQAAADLGQSYVSRNDKCPCGSGKKAKHCCLNQIKMLKALPDAVRARLITDSILRQPQPQPAPVPAAVAEQFAAVTMPVETATIQAEGCAPVECDGGTLTINPPEVQA